MRKLTTQDAAKFEEYGLDRDAAKRVFEHAQVRCHNTLRDVTLAENKLWEHVMEAYDLDFSKHYKVSYDREARLWLITEEKKDA